MKKKIIINEGNKRVEKIVNYIPCRYILSIILVILETIAVIAVVVLLTIYIPYFYILVIGTQAGVAIAIINSKDNPDYKLPWLFFTLVLPIVGFMLYFMFYSRSIDPRKMKRIKKYMDEKVSKDDTIELFDLKKESDSFYSQATLLSKLSSSHLYKNTEIKYYPTGVDYFESIKEDISKAKKFIFLEYFIIEDGLFWDTILKLLLLKIAEGVEVRLLYDDIGCMMTLPGNYYKTLRKNGIKAIQFSRLRGQANNEFNNRNHRKITIIDGEIAYTGGINLADEYINHIEKFGHWKDTGVRIKGETVNEFTRLFLMDYGLNDKKQKDNFPDYYTFKKCNESGYCIPFGDGPKPIYERNVAKTMVLHMLYQSKKYVYITTPYLIIDNELVQALENAAKRGVDIRIITPHIPDKELVFLITRSYYRQLIEAGVRIYEYEKGFIHAKTYISDDEVAILGTINMDYRSFVHHFENGLWIYKNKVIEEIKNDFIDTEDKSIMLNQNMLKQNLFQRFIKAMAKIFSPLF